MRRTDGLIDSFTNSSGRSSIDNRIASEVDDWMGGDKTPSEIMAMVKGDPSVDFSGSCFLNTQTAIDYKRMSTQDAAELGASAISFLRAIENALRQHVEVE